MAAQETTNPKLEALIASLKESQDKTTSAVISSDASVQSLNSQIASIGKSIVSEIRTSITVLQSAIKNIKIPSNLNIIDSFLEHDGIKYLNFSNYDVISNLRNKTKSIICPNTKGGYLKNIHKKDKQSKQYIKGDKLKKMTCSDCLYCIDKKNVLFVQH